MANAHFADETWTAGTSGMIGFHEHNDTGITGATGGGIIAVAHIGGGVVNVQFHCTSGTGAGSSPGVPTFSDAPNLAGTQITNPSCKTLRKKLKKARAHNKAKVKKIKRLLRKNGC